MAKVNVGSEEYSYWTGLWKSLKNVGIVLGGAAVIHLVETRTQWLPEKYKWLDLLIGGFLAYWIKNRVQFNKK